MPIHTSPTIPSVAFTVGSLLSVVGLLIWWLMAKEYRHPPALPIIFLGTAISALVVEPIFDNTLLYWYPPDNDLGVYAAYGRTVPWFVPVGYAWFFGGNAYVLCRLFQRGLSRNQILGLFGIVVVIDALATSTAGWLNISGFYGPQPFLWGGVNVWFSFADATGVIVGATVLHVLAPRLHGWRWLWLLVTPTIAYGAVLGGVCSPVTLGLHSDWTTLGRWLGGAATIALCCVVAYACARITERNTTVELMGPTQVASDSRISA
jgi:hypothetical protein